MNTTGQRTPLLTAMALSGRRMNVAIARPSAAPVAQPTTSTSTAGTSAGGGMANTHQLVTITDVALTRLSEAVVIPSAAMTRPAGIGVLRTRFSSPLPRRRATEIARLTKLL